MAITLTSVNLHSAAFAPLEFTITSDKLKPENDKAIIALYSPGGFASLGVSAVGNFKVGDRILIAGATVDFAYLNGYANVTAIVDAATKEVTTDRPFQSGISGDLGTITRANVGVKEKIILSVDDPDLATYVTIATFYVFPIFDGTNYSAKVDISPFLRANFNTTFNTTAGFYPEFASRSHYIAYNCDVFEMCQKVDTTYYTAAAVNLETPDSKKDLFAHRMTELRVCDGGTPLNKFLTDFKTQYFKPGDKIMISALLTTKDEAMYKFGGSGGFNIPADSDVEDIEYFYFNATIQTNSGAFSTPNFTVQVGNSFGEAGQWVSETLNFIVDNNCTAYPVTLYFLNRYGGFDIYHFKETDKDTFKVEKWKNKTMQNVTGTTREKVLIGRPETYANMKILRDLISSPEIYDTSGNRVYLKSTDMILKDGDSVVYPEITIEEYENDYING